MFRGKGGLSSDALDSEVTAPTGRPRENEDHSRSLLSWTEMTCPAKKNCECRKYRHIFFRST